MKYFLLALLLGACSFAAFGCDCLMPPIQEHIRQTPFLLRATATQLLDGASQESRDHRQFVRSMNPQADTVTRGHEARIRIEEDYKGLLKAGDMLDISSHYSNCELTFQVGQQYLLFLHQENGKFFITMCSYSEQLDGSSAVNNVLEMIQQESKKKRKRTK